MFPNGRHQALKTCFLNTCAAAHQTFPSAQLKRQITCTKTSKTLLKNHPNFSINSVLELLTFSPPQGTIFYHLNIHTNPEAPIVGNYEKFFSHKRTILVKNLSYQSTDHIALDPSAPREPSRENISPFIQHLIRSNHIKNSSSIQIKDILLMEGFLFIHPRTERGGYKLLF